MAAMPQIDSFVSIRSWCYLNVYLAIEFAPSALFSVAQAMKWIPEPPYVILVCEE